MLQQTCRATHPVPAVCLARQVARQTGPHPPKEMSLKFLDALRAFFSSATRRSAAAFSSASLASLHGTAGGRRQAAAAAVRAEPGSAAGQAFGWCLWQGKGAQIQPGIRCAARHSSACTFSRPAAPPHPLPALSERGHTITGAPAPVNSRHNVVKWVPQHVGAQQARRVHGPVVVVRLLLVEAQHVVDRVACMCGWVGGGGLLCVGAPQAFVGRNLRFRFELQRRLACCASRCALPPSAVLPPTCDLANHL